MTINDSYRWLKASVSLAESEPQSNSASMSDRYAALRMRAKFKNLRLELAFKLAISVSLIINCSY